MLTALTLQAMRRLDLSCANSSAYFFIYTIRKHSVPVNILYTIFYASVYHHSLLNAEMFVRNAGYCRREIPHRSWRSFITYGMLLPLLQTVFGTTLN